LKPSRRIREIDLERTYVDRRHLVGIVGRCPEGEGSGHEIEPVHEPECNDHHFRITQGNKEIAPFVLAK